MKKVSRTFIQKRERFLYGMTLHYGIAVPSRMALQFLLDAMAQAKNVRVASPIDISMQTDISTDAVSRYVANALGISLETLSLMLNASASGHATREVQPTMDTLILNLSSLASSRFVGHNVSAMDATSDLQLTADTKRPCEMANSKLLASFDGFVNALRKVVQNANCELQSTFVLNMNAVGERERQTNIGETDIPINFTLEIAVKGQRPQAEIAELIEDFLISVNVVRMIPSHRVSALRSEFTIGISAFAQRFLKYSDFQGMQWSALNGKTTEQFYIVRK